MNMRTWGRRLVTVLAAVVTLLVVVIVVGTLFAPTRLIAAIGSVFTSFFTLHVVLAGLAGIALALQARRLGGRRAAAIVLWLAILATAGAAVPLVELVRTAHRTAQRFPGGRTFGRSRPDRAFRRIKRNCSRR